MDNVVAVASDAPSVSVKSPDAPQDPVYRHAVKDTSNMPLEVWNRENHDEYLSVLLNMGDKFEYLPVQEQEQLSSISEYIINRMNEEGYEPTTKAYKAMMEKVQKELKIDKNVSRESMLDRIHGYVDSLSMIKEIKGIDEKKLLDMVRKCTTKQQMTNMIMGVVAKSLK